MHKKDSHTIIVLTKYFTKITTLFVPSAKSYFTTIGWMTTYYTPYFHKYFTFVIACSSGPGRTHPPSAFTSHMKEIGYRPWRFGNNEHYSCDG